MHEVESVNSRECDCPLELVNLSTRISVILLLASLFFLLRVCICVYA